MRTRNQSMATIVCTAAAALALALAGPGPLAIPVLVLALFVASAAFTGLAGRYLGSLACGIWLLAALALLIFQGGAREALALVQWPVLVAPLAGYAFGVSSRALRLLLARMQEARQDADGARREIGSLRESLDTSPEGIVVLDSEMRAQFANVAFRRIFAVPDEMARRKPTFGEIVDHGCALRLYGVAEQQLAEFAQARKAYVKSGANLPVMLRMADRKMYRFKCSPLPGGGRLLNYTDVTDLVQDAERLEELANIDGMTGLLNRRQFLDLAGHEWARAARYQRQLSVLMLDIDHFKSVNDRFGHDVGDRAICHVASICGESKRATDLAARVGGEEFAILLPETALEGAMVIAERFRARIEANAVPGEGAPLRLTVSIGAAELGPDVADFAALLKKADRMLYAAKQAGRNRVATALAA